MSNKTITIETINDRYSELSESNCCLSCGGAIDLAEIKLGYRCADLGSGRGNDVLRLADLAGKDGFAWGIDVSDGMLRKARKNAKKLGVNNVEFIQSELEDLKLEENSIDLLISNCTINHASDKLKVWSEIYRVLKDGGHFVVSDIYSTIEVPEKYRNDPQAIAECWAGSTTKEEYLATLKKAGFDKIEILEDSAPYPKGEIEVSSWTIKSHKKKTNI